MEGRSHRSTRRGWVSTAGVLSIPALAAATGCGGLPSGSAAPAAAISRGTRVKFLSNGNDFFGGPRAQALAPVIQEWKQKTGLEVDQIDNGTATYMDRLQVLLASDSVPDVVYVGGSTDPLGNLLLLNALRPL